jgi:hypothetical protein
VAVVEEWTVCEIFFEIIGEGVALLFHVRYGSENRENKIREMAETDLTVGVILAAVHFEWTMKRAILKLSKTPTVDVRKSFRWVSGWDTYKEKWREEVSSQPRFIGMTLGSIVHTVGDMTNKAFKERGKLVHGAGATEPDKAKTAINQFLLASALIREFTMTKGYDIDKNLKPRPRKRKQTKGQ